MSAFLNVEATRLLKAAMAREGYTPSSLAALLAAKGYRIDRRTLTNRINRGSFTFSFYLLCMTTMGCTDVSFRLKRPPTSDSAKGG